MFFSVANDLVGSYRISRRKRLFFQQRLLPCYRRFTTKNRQESKKKMTLIALIKHAKILTRTFHHLFSWLTNPPFTLWLILLQNQQLIPMKKSQLKSFHAENLSTLL